MMLRSIFKIAYNDLLHFHPYYANMKLKHDIKGFEMEVAFFLNHFRIDLLFLGAFSTLLIDISFSSSDILAISELGPTKNIIL